MVAQRVDHPRDMGVGISIDPDGHLERIDGDGGVCDDGHRLGTALYERVRRLPPSFYTSENGPLGAHDTDASESSEPVAPASLRGSSLDGGSCRCRSARRVSGRVGLWFVSALRHAEK